MVGGTGPRSHTHTGWWLAGAVLLALAALLAWTARQNDALRARVAVLERDNRSLQQALALRAAPPSTAPPAAVRGVGAPLASAPTSGSDPMAAVARAPASSPRRQGLLEEALQAQREAASRAGSNPFGRP